MEIGQPSRPTRVDVVQLFQVRAGEWHRVDGRERLGELPHPTGGVWRQPTDSWQSRRDQRRSTEHTPGLIQPDGPGHRHPDACNACSTRHSRPATVGSCSMHQSLNRRSTKCRRALSVAFTSNQCIPCEIPPLSACTPASRPPGTSSATSARNLAHRPAMYRVLEMAIHSVHRSIESPVVSLRNRCRSHAARTRALWIASSRNATSEQHARKRLGQRRPEIMGRRGCARDRDMHVKRPTRTPRRGLGVPCPRLPTALLQHAWTPTRTRHGRNVSVARCNVARAASLRDGLTPYLRHTGTSRAPFPSTSCRS